MINKFYRKIANNGNDGDYELVGTIGVNGIELAVLQGCSASANGQQGLVPAPASGYQNRILTGDATLKTVNTLLSNSGMIKNNLTTSSSGSILDAYQGKVLNDKITSTNSTVSSLNSKITTANNNISSNTTKINTANSNISSANTKINSLQSTVNGMLKIGTKTVNCVAGVSTFKETLSRLGLTGKTILSCQCCNSTSSVCKIIGFSVSGGYLYISFDGTNQVGTSQIRIVYC